MIFCWRVSGVALTWTGLKKYIKRDKTLIKKYNRISFEYLNQQGTVCAIQSQNVTKFSLAAYQELLQQTVSVTSIFNFGHIVKSLEVKEGIILKTFNKIGISCELAHLVIYRMIMFLDTHPIYNTVL